MAARLVTIYGGSGFVGRHLVRALAQQGWRIRVAVRRPDLAGHLQPLGMVGQIHAVQANLRYPESVMRAAEGAEAVVNLVAILAESGRQTFQRVHVDGAGAVAEAAARAGAARLIHFSAIGADAESPSAYGRSKAAGEAVVKAAFPAAMVLRPSIIFGPEDAFFNRFAAMARFSPALPLIGGGHTKFQPVYVGDVASAAAKLVAGGGKPAATYELGGPEVKNFRELMEFMLSVTGRKRALVPLPFPIARLKASVLELLPGRLLTQDQVAMLEADNVVGEAAKAGKLTLEGLGIRPTSMEAVVPSYLYRFRKHGQFERADVRG